MLNIIFRAFVLFLHLVCNHWPIFMAQ